MGSWAGGAIAQTLPTTNAKPFATSLAVEGSNPTPQDSAPAQDAAAAIEQMASTNLTVDLMDLIGEMSKDWTAERGVVQQTPDSSEIAGTENSSEEVSLTPAPDISSTITPDNVPDNASDITPDTAPDIAPEIAQAVSAHAASSNSRWYVQGEALFLQRNLPDRTTTVDGNTGERSGTDDLSFGLDAGIRLTVGYRLSPQGSVELSGFGLVNHEDSRTITSSILSPGGEVLNSTFDPDIADTATSSFALSFQQRLRVTSEARNFELNYRHTVSPSASRWRGSLLAGLRYFSLDDDLQLSAIGEDPDIFPSTSEGRYTIDVQNDGVGLQLGGDFGYAIGRNVDLGVRLRTGLLLNTTEQESVLRNNAGGLLVTSEGEGRDTELSPLLEVGAFLNWHLSRQVSLNLGYTLLWLGNVGLAPDQFASSSDLARSLSGLERGSVLYHGPSIGLLVRF